MVQLRLVGNIDRTNRLTGYAFKRTHRLKPVVFAYNKYTAANDILPRLKSGEDVIRKTFCKGEPFWSRPEPSYASAAIFHTPFSRNAGMVCRLALLMRFE